MDMKNMRILLACSAGMSTSLLEKKIEDYLALSGKTYKAVAMSSSAAKAVLKDFDVILLGPQVRYMLSEFKQLSNNKPVGVIPPNVYGLMKGKETIELAEATFTEHYK